MPQYHYAQFGIVHVTTNTCEKRPWCTMNGVPMILIETLFLVRFLQKAKVYAFCILPTHVHLILSPGEKGLSSFMHSFKTNSSKNVKVLIAKSQIATTRDNSCGESNAQYFRSCGESNAQYFRSCGESNAQYFRSRGIVPRSVDAHSAIFTGWQKGYHDEIIRTSDQFSAVLGYVQGNAGKHKIVMNFADWPWSSLHFQEQLDLVEVWTH